MEWAHKKKNKVSICLEDDCLRYIPREFVTKYSEKTSYSSTTTSLVINQKVNMIKVRTKTNMEGIRDQITSFTHCSFIRHMCSYNEPGSSYVNKSHSVVY